MDSLNDAVQVLRNRFNDETFIFPTEANGAAAASFEVILGDGGSSGGNAL